MAVSHEEFRQALGRFASGVTVVTCKSDRGNLCGLTVSAFSSLSLEPPLVLICIDGRASVYADLQEAPSLRLTSWLRTRNLFRAGLHRGMQTGSKGSATGKEKRERL